MATNAELIAQWERVQTKTFTSWTNMHLAKRGLNINSVATDLRDGTMLLQLLEIISDESVGPYNKNPKMRVQMAENAERALKFIAAHDVKLVNIGAVDIIDGNLKATLGLIWTIILRFAIAGLSEEGLSAKEGLLLWVQRKTAGYKGVNVQNFSDSFQDGLAFCALIHRHRPDIIEYDGLSAENKADNLRLAFDTAEKHLGIPQLLDVEDIVSIPKPDERSIMTYVAALYKVFSSLDNIETAGRRIGKFAEFSKTIQELQHDYEERTRRLLAAVNGKIEELQTSALADTYEGARAQNAEFRDYKKGIKRQWVAEQNDLAALFTQIQAKLKSIGRPPYVPPAGLAVADVEAQVTALGNAEHARRTALNQNMRAILDRLRQNFAIPANAFYDQLQQLKAALAAIDGELEQQLETAKAKQQELAALNDQLPPIQAAEQELEAANVEDNEFSIHTYDDLYFEYEQLKLAFAKAIVAIEGQIAAKQQTGISAEQMEDFKNSFQHFDQDKDGSLSRLEFKSALGSMGVIELNFEGNDAKFEAIFKSVSGGSDHVTFQQYVDYLVKLNADTMDPEQLKESFATIAGGKDHVTLNDLKVAQLSQELIDYLVSVMPPHSSVPDAYDYQAYLSSL